MSEFVIVLLIIGAVWWVVRKVTDAAGTQTSSTLKTGVRTVRGATKAMSDRVQRRWDEQQEARTDRGSSHGAEPPSRGRGYEITETTRDPSPEHLIDMLRVGETYATREAVAGLIALGNEALPALRLAIRDPAPYVRHHTERAMREILENQAEVVLDDPSAQSSFPSAFPSPRPSPPPRPKPIPIPPRERAPSPPAAPPPPVPDAPSVEEPVPADVPRLDSEAIAGVLREAAQTTGFGGERAEVLAPLGEGNLAFRIVVDEVRRTSAFDASPSHRGGKTLVGRIEDEDVAVAVRLPRAAMTAEEDVPAGVTVVVRGAFVGWDTLYDRANFEAVSE